MRCGVFLRCWFSLRFHVPVVSLNLRGREGSGDRRKVRRKKYGFWYIESMVQKKVSILERHPFKLHARTVLGGPF